jgi:superfamily II DNA or RNA helicase
MSRINASMVVQATWQRGSVHVWVWDGATPVAPYMAEIAGRRQRLPLPPPSAGHWSSLALELPGGRSLRPITSRLDRLNGPRWLTAIDIDEPGTTDLIGDSLRWFATAAQAASSIVRAGQFAPVLRPGEPIVATATAPTEAVWQPLPSKQLGEVTAMLDASMPPIAGTEPGVQAAPVIGAFVDGLARRQLARVGWSPSVPSDRRPATAMTKAIFRALSRADPRVPTASLGPPKFASLDDLGRRLDRHRRRGGGEPVLLPRLRLVVPNDPADPWTIELELVDEADPGRWCSGTDVWKQTPLAVEVASGAEHLGLLATTLRDTAARIATDLPVLAELGNVSEPGPVELDVDAAAEFLEAAPAVLEAAGIALIGPESLIRAAVGVRGNAAPSPPSDRTGGFNRETIVDWSLTVAESDGPVAISAAELARAEASGSTLLHTGHRWVRIDPQALRRARVRLDEYAERSRAATTLELLRLAADAAAAGDDLAATEPGAGDVDDADRLADWSGRLLTGLPDERLREETESATFTGELRHYQRRALSWLRFLARLGLGGCLADDMGLGKTATALAHLVDRPGPHLVVCPLSVVHNWETEAARFTPSIDVTVHYGATRSRIGDGNLAPDELAGAGLVVTTYGLLTRDIEQLAAVEWSTVVLDEAQFVKNAATKAARAVRRLRAGQRIALTGTPVENRLAELWSILDGVNPGMLGSRESFRHRYSKPIERGDDSERTAEATAQLRTLTQPFVLRRTKADRSLVPELPDKVEQIAYAGLTREQATLYRNVVDQLLSDADEHTGMRRRGLILAAINRLKQICNHPAHALGDGGRLHGRSGKLARFDELVDELLDVGERALVFTQYVEMGKLLQRHLGERRSLTAPFLHGSLGRRQRTSMIERFQNGDGAPLLIVSLKAGGTGLNLTAASQVIHYDRWWNPAVENQATDRSWRIGQQHTVLVHKLVSEGTIEERIDKLITDKQALADLVVGSGEQWLSELSTAELRDLVRLDAGDTPGRWETR